MEAALRNHLEKFVRLPDDEFDSICSYFTNKTVRKNKRLISVGDTVSTTYWVKNGLLISNHTDADGKEHIIQFAIENCWITDQNAFYNQEKAVFDIVALETSEMLCLSYNNREELCARYPAMGHFFRKKANDSFVKLQKRLLTYLTSNARERFDLLMFEYPGLYQRLSKKILAAYLGVTRETLSRFRD